MRFEKTHLAAALGVGASAAFNCESWREKLIQVIGTGVVSIEGSIDGLNFSPILGVSLTSPIIVEMPEMVSRVRATWVSGVVDVWLSGLNSQTE